MYFDFDAVIDGPQEKPEVFPPSKDQQVGKGEVSYFKFKGSIF